MYQNTFWRTSTAEVALVESLARGELDRGFDKTELCFVKSAEFPSGKGANPRDSSVHVSSLVDSPRKCIDSSSTIM